MVEEMSRSLHRVVARMLLFVIQESFILKHPICDFKFIIIITIIIFTTDSKRTQNVDLMFLPLQLTSDHLQTVESYIWDAKTSSSTQIRIH